jgi:hypothetical protein
MEQAIYGQDPALHDPKLAAEYARMRILKTIFGHGLGGRKVTFHTRRDHVVEVWLSLGDATPVLKVGTLGKFFPRNMKV